jgi:hypothetical protein
VRKVVWDGATLGLGLNREMQLRRLKPVAPALEQEWRQLREDLAASHGPDGNVN